MADPAPAPAFQIQTSRHFAAFLAAQRTSLAFTTYQSGKLFLIGLKPTGELSVFERTFNRCMGLWADAPDALDEHAYQLWRFENALRAGRDRTNGYDRLYVPRDGPHDRRPRRPRRRRRRATAASSSSTRSSRCLATVSETAQLPRALAAAVRLASSRPRTAAT